MSRIKLRSLLNLTEQAPQPPGGMGSPVPAAVAPQTDMGTGQDVAPTPETPTSTGPAPEDPSEYDFTRDFRAFEDKKNKAEAEAKKELLDKMNEKLLGKTIVANASRGYGQPKTDYTIKNIKKISVEFWYKDYVVIAADENEKKYFLTPGINIKIEQGSEPAPGGEQPQSPESGQEQPAVGGSPSDEEVPNNPSVSGQPPAGADEQPAVGGEKPAPEQTPQPQPESPKVPQPQAPQTQPPSPEDQLQQKKKKKLPLAEIQKDLNGFLLEFMSDLVKDKNGRINFVSYIKEEVEILVENKNTTKIKCKLLIPENHFVSKIDERDIKLASVDYMKQNKPYGQYSKGSVEVIKNGRYYLLEYVKEIGWK